MGMLTVRNLDESIKTMLRVQAAQHGWAMEEEVRRILTQAMLQPKTQPQEYGLGTQIRTLFSDIDTEDLPIAPRRPARPAPQFD